jgi:hypothetical protein
LTRSVVNEADDHQCLVMGGEVSIGLEVEAFELRGPNRSNNVSSHGSSIHLNYSSGCSNEFWRPQKLDHQLMVWSLSPLGCLPDVSTDEGFQASQQVKQVKIER